MRGCVGFSPALCIAESHSSKATEFAPTNFFGPPRGQPSSLPPCSRAPGTLRAGSCLGLDFGRQRCCRPDCGRTTGLRGVGQRLAGRIDAGLGPVRGLTSCMSWRASAVAIGRERGAAGAA
jgi:hypothetical protein